MDPKYALHIRDAIFKYARLLTNSSAPDNATEIVGSEHLALCVVQRDQLTERQWVKVRKFRKCSYSLF